MGTPDLTVKVLNISTETTLEDLVSFFSYCGTIDDIKLEKDGDQAQLAMVTFKQPYAYQTALLLNGASIVDRRVCILPVNFQAKSSKLDKQNSEAQNARGRFAPTQCPSFQTIASKGHGMLNKAKELDEKYRVSEAGRAATEKSSAAISAAEQAAGQLGSAILSSTCFSKSALWLSDVLDKASKRAAEMGNYKYRDTNTRKQK